jgi:AraC-like DNA-binding protein
LTLEGEQLLRYEHWLTLLAVLLAEQRGAKLLGREAAMLSASLEEARFVERMWESTKEMVDEATTGVWMSPQLGDDLLRLGSERLPEHVVIGLVARSPASDPVDVLLRTDAFRRACVDLALASRAVCGLVGSQGVVFLQSSAGLGSRARGDQTRLAEDARSLARVHGLSLHVGISSDDRGHLLPARYEQALGAAERALSEGLTVARAESRFAPLPASNALRSLRHDLGSLHSGRAEALVAKLDHYVEAVAVHTGGRLELSRPHLEVGFESAERALLGTGAVPEPIAQETNQMLERSVRDAASLAELSAAYRRAVVELAEVVDHPGTANQARSLRRALSFIREHLSEPLGLTHVSRVAGFSPNYFSQLFKRSEGTTFELHVRKVRIEHAKELLASTDLEIRRVVQLAGFSSREHFHRAFKAVVGTTPVAYRRSRPVSRHRAPAVRKTRGRAPK